MESTEKECVGVERRDLDRGEGGREGKRALGRCFAEVSALDKVFMTLGRFSADIQELHATRPLMKVSWPNSTVCHCSLAAAAPRPAHHIITATASTSLPGRLINSKLLLGWYSTAFVRSFCFHSFCLMQSHKLEGRCVGLGPFFYLSKAWTCNADWRVWVLTSQADWNHRCR